MQLNEEEEKYNVNEEALYVCVASLLLTNEQIAHQRYVDLIVN